jgi:hypothetical protein
MLPKPDLLPSSGEGREIPTLYGFLELTSITKGAYSNVVVKALCYKPEGRGFDTR